MATLQSCTVVAMHGQTRPGIATDGDDGTAQPPRRLLSLQQAADALSITVREVYRRLDDGDLESVWIGRRRLVTVESIDAYIGRLREEAQLRRAAA